MRKHSLRCVLPLLVLALFGCGANSAYNTKTPTVNSQTISFGTLPNVPYGTSSVTLTASASSGLPVNYTTTGPVNVSGSTLTITGAGAASVTANQGGNANYSAASPVTQFFTISKASLTVTANSASMIYGASLPSFSAAITGFVNGDTQAIVTGTPTLSTTASSTSAVGTYSITVGQGTLAAANYTFALVNGVLTVTGNAAQTITFPTMPNVVALSAISPSATASSSLTVTFTSLTPSVCSTTQALTTGTCTIQANQAGNVDYSAAPAVQSSFTVTAAAQTITFPAMPNVPALSAITPVATSSSQTPIVFTSQTPTVCSITQALTSGTCTIQAAQAATHVYAAATPVTQSFTVTLVSSTITWATPTAITYGTPLTATQLNATANVPGTFTYSPAAGTVLGTGVQALSVTFTPANAADYTTATTNVNLTVNKAGLTVTANNASMVFGTTVPSLTYTITGFVNGDTQGTATTGSPALSTTGTSTSPVGPYVISIAAGTLTSTNYTFIFANGTLTVTGGASQSITFPTPVSQQALTNETLTATASSSLPVNYTTSTPLVCSVTNSAVSLLTAGTCTITAAQLGNNTYAAATSVTQSFNVTLIPQTITPGTTPAGVQALGNFSVTGTAPSLLPVIATSQTSTVCTTTTALTAGSCSIQLTQPGNASYAAAAPLTVTFTVALASQTITFPVMSSVQVLSVVAPTATSTSGLTVTYTSQTPTICSPTQALTIGTCTIEADQAGNGTVYAAAISATQSFQVTGLTQTITFPAPTPAFPTFQVSATSNDPNATVTFSTTSTACQVSTTGLVTEELSGDCLIEADSVADSTYTAAVPATQDITIGQILAVVSVAPSSVTLAPGATQQFTATGYDQFNKPMQTVQTFVWTTGSGAGIDQTGFYTAINGGDTQLSDTVTATDGTIASTPAAVTLSPAAPVLTTVVLGPSNPTINAPNGTANFSITAQDQFGRSYSPLPTCTYSSSNSAAATIGANGLATATNTGTIAATTTITAVCGSFTEMTLLTVNPPPFIKTLNVAPVTVPEFSATSVAVTATDEYGNPFPISAGQITLGSFNSALVSVAVSTSPTAALNIGGVAGTTSTPVTISVGNVSTTFNVTVVACPGGPGCYTPVLTSITVTPETTSMEFNGTQVMAASALDQHGANFTTTFTWTSNSSFLTVDANGNVAAIGIGSGTISASSNGVTGTSAIVTITDAPYPSTPVITSLFPSMAVAKTYAGSTQLGLEPHSTAIVVTGTGFLPGAIVCFGSDCGASYTTYKSSTKLVMLVPWQDLTTAGPVNITVQDPALVGYTDQSTTIGAASAPSVFTLTTKGFVTITFDDGFASGLTGTALFNAQDIKTTQFIITGNTCATIGTCATNGLRSDGYPWGWNGVGPATGCQYASYKLPVTPAEISECSVGVGFPDYITWTNVASLAAAGNEIAPHTRSHNQLSLESAADVTGELQGALADLQWHAAVGHDTVAGYTITSVFAFPYGDYGCYASEVPPVGTFNTCVTGQFNDQQLGTQVKTAGYRGARTSDAALEGGLKYEEMPPADDCSLDSCYGRADQPIFLQTITADQTAGDTCSFAGGTVCDTSSSNGAAACVDTVNKVPTYNGKAAPGFQCWVDNAVQTGSWVILLFHRVDDNTASDKSLSVNSTEIQKLALYLKAQGITTVTFRQGLAIEGIDGQYEAVDTNGNIIAYPDPID